MDYSFFRRLSLVLILILMSVGGKAQTAVPTITFYSVDKKEDVTMTEGGSEVVQAPCEITCEGGLEYDDDVYDKVVCEWKIFKADEGETSPIIDRYDVDINYTLTESGGYGVKFYATFIDSQNNDTVEFVTENGFSIVVSTSKLTCSDGLSPNGDLKNDELKIECQSIVKAEGYIMNRWGKVLHTFNENNLADGWDGKVNGKPVKDGAYLLYIDAYGSDGLHYKIKKAINVLKGYNESAESNSTEG